MLKITMVLILLNTLFVNSIFSQNFQVTGDASDLGGDTFLLTPDLNNQVGAVWNKLRHNWDTPFSVEGEMFFGDLDNGADGIVFVLQNECLLEGVIGYGIGYDGLPGQSLGVEFDTYQNNGGNVNDPVNDHIAIHRDGTVNHNVNLAGPVQMSATQANVEDNTWHDFRIDYDPSTFALDIYFDGNLRMSYTIDIVNTIFSGNPYAYWGFTSATGGSRADNSVAIHDYTSLKIQDTTICLTSTQITLPPLSSVNWATGQTFSASSSENSGTGPGQAFDENYGTRWSSQFSDPQWIMVDLGAPRNIDSVRLYWEGAYGTEYIIQTSTDNISWTDEFHEYAGNGGFDQINFTATGVRYVRMLGLQRATGYGYSLYEFEVYGLKQYAWAPNDGSIDDTTSSSPTFTPTATTTYTLTIPDECTGATTIDFTIEVDCTILPIELVQFTAVLDDRHVDVDWTTESELNNDYFIVERSEDGIIWKNIGEVDGAGNSIEELFYSLEDNSINWGIKGYYYRLVQVDFDHTQTYSPMVYVPLNHQNTEMVIYPNPSHDVLHILGGDIDEENFAIFDVSGAVVKTNKLLVDKSVGHLVLDVSELASGVYVVRAGTESKRFIKN